MRWSSISGRSSSTYSEEEESHHLLGDLPDCQVLLLLRGIDEAPDSRICASHERPEPIVPFFRDVGGSGEADHHHVLLILHPRVEESRVELCADPSSG